MRAERSAVAAAHHAHAAAHHPHAAAHHAHGKRWIVGGRCKRHGFCIACIPPPPPGTPLKPPGNIGWFHIGADIIGLNAYGFMFQGVLHGEEVIAYGIIGGAAHVHVRHGTTPGQPTPGGNAPGYAAYIPLNCIGDGGAPGNPVPGHHGHSKRRIDGLRGNSLTGCAPKVKVPGLVPERPRRIHAVAVRPHAPGNTPGLHVRLVLKRIVWKLLRRPCELTSRATASRQVSRGTSRFLVMIDLSRKGGA